MIICANLNYYAMSKYTQITATDTTSSAGLPHIVFTVYKLSCFPCAVIFFLNLSGSSSRLCFAGWLSTKEAKIDQKMITSVFERLPRLHRKKQAHRSLAPSIFGDACRVKLTRTPSKACRADLNRLHVLSSLRSRMH